MAGRLFDLDPEVIQVASDGFSDLIDQLGKNCTLVYPEGWVADASLVSGPVGGLPPTTWVGGQRGGPDWRRDVAGYKATAPTDTVKLLVAWQPKDFWVRPTQGVVLPGGAIQTKGFMTDLAKVMAADHLLVQVSLQAQVRLKFQRDGDPVDPNNIVPNTFFVCNWVRVG